MFMKNNSESSMAMKISQAAKFNWQSFLKSSYIRYALENYEIMLRKVNVVTWKLLKLKFPWKYFQVESGIIFVEMAVNNDAT